MKSRLLTVKLDTKTGVLIYETRNGMPLLKELENVKAFIPVNDAGRATYSVYQSFKTDKDEGLYGLGQLQNGQMMQRGIEKYLVQGNTEDVTPVFSRLRDMVYLGIIMQVRCMLTMKRKRRSVQM